MEEQVTREEFEALEKRVADLEQELQSRPEQKKAIDQLIQEHQVRFEDFYTNQLRYTNQRMDDIRDEIRKDYINALERMTWRTPLLMAIIAIILVVCSLLLPELTR